MNLVSKFFNGLLCVIFVMCNVSVAFKKNEKISDIKNRWTRVDAEQKILLALHASVLSGTLFAQFQIFKQIRSSVKHDMQKFRTSDGFLQSVSALKKMPFLIGRCLTSSAVTGLGMYFFYQTMKITFEDRSKQKRSNR